MKHANAPAHPADVAAYLDALARGVEKEWSRRERIPAEFGVSAVTALTLQPPARIVTTSGLAEYVLAAVSLPSQRYAIDNFADPTITLYRSDDFSIEVNFWVDSTTAIHQHSFAGAFAVLEGESIHSVWKFSHTRVVSTDLVTGQLRRAHSEVLRPGDIRVIEAGSRFVHALFHLTRPALTLVVRTEPHALSDVEPFMYLPPGIGIHPFARDSAFEAQLEIIDFLRGTSGRHADAIDRLLDRKDLTASKRVHLLLHACNKGLPGRLCRRIAKRVAAECAELQDIEETVDYWLRQRAILQLRLRVQDEDGRSLLALLLLMDDFEGVAPMLKEIGASDPARFASEHGWRIIAELSKEAGPELGYESEVLRLWLEGVDEERSAEMLRPSHPEISTDDVRAIRSLFSETPAFQALTPARTAGVEMSAPYHRVRSEVSIG